MEKQEILLETGTNEFEMLEFYIDELPTGKKEPERMFFGMNVAKVVEVIESPGFDGKHYGDNPSFLGTVPLRDLILPVVDLSVWLGFERNRVPYENIIVTEFSNSIQGFLVSGVVEIHRLTWKELIPPGKFIQKLNTKSIIGMVTTGDHFTQLLDLEHIVADLNPRMAEESWKTDVRSDTRYRALVADDSPTIRKMLEKNLATANFETRIVENGDTAYTCLLDLKQEAAVKGCAVTDLLDIVISDIEMPLLDGFTLTRKIKEDPHLKELPVILYSSIITDELRHKGEAVRADFQVSKPEMHQMAEKAIALIVERKGDL